MSNWYSDSWLKCNWSAIEVIRFNSSDEMQRPRILSKWCDQWCNNDQQMAHLSDLVHWISLVHHWSFSSLLQCGNLRVRFPFGFYWGIRVLHARFSYCGSGTDCQPSTEAFACADRVHVWTTSLHICASTDFRNDSDSDLWNLCRNFAADDANSSTSYGLLLDLRVRSNSLPISRNEILISTGALARTPQRLPRRLGRGLFRRLPLALPLLREIYTNLWST